MIALIDVIEFAIILLAAAEFISILIIRSTNRNVADVYLEMTLMKQELDRLKRKIDSDD